MSKAHHIVRHLLGEEDLNSQEDLNDQQDLTPDGILNSMPRQRPRITTTYAVTTPESAAMGDHEETGWEDEEGVSMIPDTFDQEEGLTPVDLAVDFLQKKGATESSSSHFHPGTWYTSRSEDYTSDRDTEYNYHLEDFTESQEAEIFRRMNER